VGAAVVACPVLGSSQRSDPILDPRRAGEHWPHVSDPGAIVEIAITPTEITLTRTRTDALLFTTSETPRNSGFNIVTDAYAVEGDALTARRQLVAVRKGGYIATMQEPSNNHPHTFVYRRSRIQID
jgi:hypothetical protein